MTPGDINELQVLQEAERLGELNLDGTARLHILRTALAKDFEQADNPATPFVDESRRPQLDGTDYGDEQRKRSCDEAKQFALLLAARFGEAFAKAALQAAAAGLKG